MFVGDNQSAFRGTYMDLHIWNLDVVYKVDKFDLPELQ